MGGVSYRDRYVGHTLAGSGAKSQLPANLINFTIYVTMFGSSLALNFCRSRPVVAKLGFLGWGGTFQTIWERPEPVPGKFPGFRYKYHLAC